MLDSRLAAECPGARRRRRACRHRPIPRGPLAGFSQYYHGIRVWDGTHGTLEEISDGCLDATMEAIEEGIARLEQMAHGSLQRLIALDTLLLDLQLEGIRRAVDSSD